ncbi:fasciclin domain-containing protein [Maricaulis sp.]|uniref:fasciclin domain-containing protein n=2 Tax=unclassified Maricaulis TaxID=2632371 RepID=UPI001B11785E|nr:fasciclin domain-containing protein [Maricaulis sp.]MBO6796667.1 fasciclin domain-containing protein [Maricaulis sp.]
MRLVTCAAIAASLFAAPALAGDDTKRNHTNTASMRADIVDTAVNAGQFDTLVAAVQAAGLVDTLKSDGPFTVFAPLDSAFAGLPHGEVQRLLLPENRHELVDILTYHVVPGAITSDQLSGQILAVETVEGSTVLIDATDGVRVGNAQVVQADIRTSNGVIHVVDRVIIPTAN